MPADHSLSVGVAQLPSYMAASLPSIDSPTATIRHGPSRERYGLRDEKPLPVSNLPASPPRAALHRTTAPRFVEIPTCADTMRSGDGQGRCEPTVLRSHGRGHGFEPSTSVA
jgi:hypothetical protein